MEIFLALWLVFGICSAIVASNRGADGCLWFALGVFLGPIGFALAFTTGAKCPQCASRISSEARICPRCRSVVRTIAPTVINPGSESSQNARMPGIPGWGPAAWVAAAILAIMFLAIYYGQKVGVQ